MNVITAAQLILSLLPVITDVVKQVEAMNTSQGNGAQKLQLALTLVKAVYDSTNPAEPFDSIKGKVESVIGAVVTFYNTVKAFSHGTKAA